MLEPHSLARVCLFAQLVVPHQLWEPALQAQHVMFAGNFALEVEDRVLAKHVVMRHISAASCSQSFSPGRTVAVTLQITALQVTLPMP